MMGYINYGNRLCMIRFSTKALFVLVDAVSAILAGDEGLVAANGGPGVRPLDYGIEKPAMHAQDGHLDDRQIARRNNKGIVWRKLREAMAGRNYTEDERNKYLELGKRAVRGDDPAINTLEKDGIISRGDHRALKEGARGNPHNIRHAINHNMRHHPNLRPKRGHHEYAGLSHGEAVNKEIDQLRTAAAHGNGKASERLNELLYGRAGAAKRKGRSDKAAWLDRNERDHRAYEGGLGSGAKRRKIDYPYPHGGNTDPRDGKHARHAHHVGNSQVFGHPSYTDKHRRPIREDDPLQDYLAPGRGPVLYERLRRDPLLQERLRSDPLWQERVRKDPLLQERFLKDPPLYERLRNDPVLYERLRNDPPLQERFLRDPILQDHLLRDPLFEGRGDSPHGHPRHDHLQRGRPFRDDAPPGHIPHERLYDDLLEDEAAKANVVNSRKRAIANHLIADKVRDKDRKLEDTEREMKIRTAYGYPPTPSEIAAVKDADDVANSHLLVEKAEAFLAEDRDATKAALLKRSADGDPRAVKALKDIETMEKAAAGTVRGAPPAAADFASMISSMRPPYRTQRLVQPLSKVSDEEAVAAVAAQVGGSINDRARAEEQDAVERNREKDLATMVDAADRKRRQRFAAATLARSGAIAAGATPEEADEAAEHAVRETASRQDAADAASMTANAAEREAADAGTAARELSDRANNARATARAASFAAAEHEAAAEAPVDEARIVAADEEKADFEMKKELSNRRPQVSLSNFIRRTNADKDRKRREAAEEEAAKSLMEETARREEARAREAEAEAEAAEMIMPPRVNEKAEAENQKAIMKEDAEVRRTEAIAYENVRAAGGPPEVASAEAAQAGEIARRKAAVERAARMEKAAETLAGQMPSSAIDEAASHLALAHGGGDGRQEEEESAVANRDFSVVKAISDDASEVPLKNAEIRLPVMQVPSVPARTPAEASRKAAQAALRDSLRNTVTATEVATGLPVIRGAEGFLHVPESAKRIDVHRGSVFYTPAGRDALAASGGDTSALVSKVAGADPPIPGASAYYEAAVRDMALDLSTGALGNGREKLDTSHASAMQISEGALVMEPWSSFAAKVRPAVYSPLHEASERISSSEAKAVQDAETAEAKRDGSMVEMFSGLNGESIARVTPSYGLRKALRADEATLSHLGDNESEESAGVALNTAESAHGASAVDEFISKASQSAKKHPELLNDSNPLAGGNGSKGYNGLSEFVASKETLAQRDAATEENRLYNSLLENAEEGAAALNLSREDYEKRLSRITPAAFASIVDFYRRLPGNPRFNQLLGKMDSQEFFPALNTEFPEVRPSTAYRVFGKSLEKVTGLPDMTRVKLVEIKPIKNVSSIDNPDAPVVREVVSKVPFRPVSPTATYPTRPYSQNAVVPTPAQQAHIHNNMAPRLQRLTDDMHHHPSLNNNNGDPFNGNGRPIEDTHHENHLHPGPQGGSHPGHSHGAYPGQPGHFHGAYPGQPGHFHGNYPNANQGRPQNAGPQGAPQGNAPVNKQSPLQRLGAGIRGVFAR